jgi:hypothetical protein
MYTVLEWGNLRKRNYLEDLRVDEKNNFKIIHKEIIWYGMHCVDFSQYRHELC